MSFFDKIEDVTIVDMFWIRGVGRNWWSGVSTFFPSPPLPFLLSPFSSLLSLLLSFSSLRRRAP